MINLEDRRRLREFCTGVHKAGESIVALLLNEKRDGRRFWNLLKMSYVQLVDKQYIFAVQTVIDAHIPSVLRVRPDRANLNFAVTQALPYAMGKVEALRARLLHQSQAPLTDLRDLAQVSLNEVAAPRPFGPRQIGPRQIGPREGGSTPGTPKSRGKSVWTRYGPMSAR